MNNEALLYQEDGQELYREDVREKSILAKSAHHKGRRHSLAYDRLYTKKELEKMSGPVKSYNLNAPMTYAEFKAMPQDLRARYLQELVNKYEIGPSAIARYFDINTGMGTRIFQSLGIKINGNASKKAAERFLTEFCGNTERPKTSERTVASNLNMKSLALHFSMNFQPSVIAERLAGLFPDGSPVNIRVEIDVAD